MNRRLRTVLFFWNKPKFCWESLNRYHFLYEVCICGTHSYFLCWNVQLYLVSFLFSVIIVEINNFCVISSFLGSQNKQNLVDYIESLEITCKILTLEEWVLPKQYFYNFIMDSFFTKNLNTLWCYIYCISFPE